MAKTPVHLPDDVVQRATSQAAEQGFANAEEYIGALIDADTTLDPDVEQLLIERIEDPRPSIEATPEFWADLRERVRRMAEQRNTAAS